ncbi:hypothetical protein Nizo2814_2797 [Lactiplantibacillus plantarum]|nr:hypothetical protein Nizo2814_2797 [Lactiplantibacillus plantarum]
MNKAINTVNARLPFKFFDQLVKELKRKPMWRQLVGVFHELLGQYSD